MSNLSQIKKNTFWLVVFQLAKMVFPFLILPVLTRRLSVEVYGDLTYVKTVMNFMQIFVDFGFMLSATKELAKINQQKLNTRKTIQEATARKTNRTRISRTKTNHAKIKRKIRTSHHQYSFCSHPPRPHGAIYYFYSLYFYSNST